MQISPLWFFFRQTQTAKKQANKDNSQEHEKGRLFNLDKRLFLYASLKLSFDFPSQIIYNIVNIRRYSEL